MGVADLGIGDFVTTRGAVEEMVGNDKGVGKGVDLAGLEDVIGRVLRFTNGLPQLEELGKGFSLASGSSSCTSESRLAIVQ